MSFLILTYALHTIINAIGSHSFQMNIGVDACSWSNKRGFGRFSRELLKALLTIDSTNRYLFFIDQQTADQYSLPDRAQVVCVRTNESPTEAASSSGRRSLSDVWTMTRRVLKEDLDLFFFPTIYSYFPILNRTKIVLTVHDMIPITHSQAVFPNRKLRRFWNLKQNLAFRQAAAIVTASQYSKQQIVKHSHLPEDLVHLLSAGAGEDFKTLPHDSAMEAVLEEYGLVGHRFLLYVGGISPHKNLRMLVDAFSMLVKQDEFADVRMVLVGDYQGDSFLSDYPLLREKVADLGLADKIIFTGYIEDRILAFLYNAASLFVLPSLEEGFGLPAVEAMACGVPVVASHTGALVEIVGDAALFFDPQNAEELLEAVRRILSNSVVAEELRRRGLQRAKNFTWTNAAERLLSVFNEVALS